MIILTTLFSGGLYLPNQLVEYDISKDEIIDHGTDALSGHGGYGPNPWFSQLNDETLYYASNDPGYVVGYDLRNISYLGWRGESAWKTPVDVTTANHFCLTSSKTPSPRLYVSGGNTDNYHGTDLKLLQVLDIDDVRWLIGLPHTMTWHMNHGCIVMNDTLWVISGSKANMIETIRIANLTSNTTETWQNTTSFDCSLGGYADFGVTSAGDLVFTVGGSCNTEPDDVMFIIDTITNSITLSTERLPYVVKNMPVVMVDNTIYGFGGRNDTTDSSRMTSWVSLNMLSICLFFPVLILFLWPCSSTESI